MSILDREGRRGVGSGLLLVGHGSREPRANEEFLATARRTAELAPSLAVEPCFLELARPNIAESFRSLAERGVSQMAVVPLLLFSAGHDQRDIPAAVASVSAGYPAIGVDQSEHLGCHDAIVQLSKLRFDEALVNRPRVAPSETALVMVGRGSRDHAATAEMIEFARLRSQVTPVAIVRTAFVAMAEPPLEGVLAEVAALGCRRVVIQPHLLFAGVLAERINLLAERFAARYPPTEWITTSHLGPSDLVVRAILDRAGFAGRRGNADIAFQGLGV
jgi:sirohydrochlorin cobaltochelatase